MFTTFFYGITRMTNELRLSERLAPVIQKLRSDLQKYAGKLVYVPQAEGFAILRWDGTAWSELTDTAPVAVGPFGQAVWLVASDRCLFQLRTFPADMVAKGDLQEAVELDISQWSPWGRDTACYFQSRKQDDVWQVSIWIWDKARENQLLALPQADGWPLSHIIPQDVWHSGELRGNQYPALTVHACGQRHIYQYLDESGLTTARADVGSAQEARHFWRSLGTKAAQVERVLISNNQDPALIPWLPSIQLQTIPLSLPASDRIERGLLPGVRNWRHPVAWKPVFYGCAALLLVWMFGSFLVVWGKEKQIAAGLAAASQGAEEVLTARDLVDDLGSRLMVVNQLQQQQVTLITALQQLSLSLPEDVWLHTMTFRQNTVEVRGQGKNAASLAGELEKNPLIRRVSYVGDIRPDASTGQEFFALRLHLDTGASPQP